MDDVRPVVRIRLALWVECWLDIVPETMGQAECPTPFEIIEVDEDSRFSSAEEE